MTTNILKNSDIFSSVGKRKRIAEIVQDVINLTLEEIEGQSLKVCRGCEGELFRASKLQFWPITRLLLSKSLPRDVSFFCPSESCPSKKASTSLDLINTPSPFLSLSDEEATEEVTTTNTVSSPEVGETDRFYMCI